MSKKLIYKNLREFERGTIYNLLCEAYSFDKRWEEANKEKWRAEADDFFFDHLDISDKCLFISTINDKPIGVVMWDPRQLPDQVTIGHNCIIPEYKGYGYGIEQMKEAIIRIKNQGAEKILVSTNRPLVPAQKMYESVGFKIIREEPNDEWYGDEIFYEWFEK